MGKRSQENLGRFMSGGGEGPQIPQKSHRISESTGLTTEQFRDRGVGAKVAQCIGRQPLGSWDSDSNRGRAIGAPSIANYTLEHQCQPVADAFQY